MAGVAAWFSFGFTLTTRLATASPSTALEWAGYHARAMGYAAAETLQKGQSQAHMRRARELARAALRREPVNVPALRTLAVVSALSGDERGADRLLAYAEALSRRDLPTQLILIERNVARDDIAGALRHYDRALRTTPRSSELLLPILVSASADHTIGIHLADLMAQRPPWWSALLDRLNADAPSSETLALVVRRLRLDVSHPTERQLFSNALGRLIQLGDYPRALSLYRAADPEGSRLLLRDGDFEMASAIPPFGWVLVDEPGLTAVRQPHQGSMALFLMAEHGRGGEVARQLLILRPGRYRLSVTAGDVAEDVASRPRLVVGCTARVTGQLTELRVPSAPSSGATASTDFIVPTDCAAQTISIHAASPLDGQAASPWLDRITLRRL